jgi:hypothetical protein
MGLKVSKIFENTKKLRIHKKSDAEKEVSSKHEV